MMDEDEDMQRIYLDHNATTPVRPAVVDAMLCCLRETFGNPSSIHHEGLQARRDLDRARRQVAELIGADPREIVFESGGTEANNHALRGVAQHCGAIKGHLVTTAIEHQAVLSTCQQLEAEGHRVTYLPVDEFGMVSAESVAAAIAPDTAVVSVMLANNEMGTIQPVKEIVEVAKAKGVLVHTDAVQAAGKIPIDVAELGVDLLSLSGHKLYGPKGIGGLYVRRGTRLTSLVRGGHQESQRRAGTENLPGIVGFGTACELGRKELALTATRLTALRDRLEQGIRRSIDDVEINGHPQKRLPNTLNVSFGFVDGESLLMNLDLLGIAASAGSACTSQTVEPSHVLIAMGRSSQQALGSLRFSLGSCNTARQIDRTVQMLVQVVDMLRRAGRTDERGYEPDSLEGPRSV